MDFTPVSAPILPTGDTVGKPKNIHEAAQQFEALLINQLLQTAKAAEGGDEDQAKQTMWDMAAQQFSQVLAHNGGFGLARMIEGGLGKTQVRSKP